MNRHASQGFTIIELTIAATVLASILMIVLSVSGTVGDSLSVNNRSAEIAERTRLVSDRIAGFLRPASLGLLEVPSGGVWILAADDTSHSSMRFRSLTGLPTQNSAALGPPRTIAFVPDSGETADGIDEDGDGLVDEGEIQLIEPSGSRSALATGVELFAIIKSGRTLEITVRIAGRDQRGTLHRSTLQESVMLWNN